MMLMQCAMRNKERVAQRSHDGRRPSPDNFGRDDYFLNSSGKKTSVEEVWGRGKRRDSKVSVLICSAIFHGQTVGEGKTRGERLARTSAVEREDMIIGIFQV